jgi:hypothetical protein
VVKRGDEVVVNEDGRRGWYATVLSVKPTRRGQAYVEVLDRDGMTWVVPEKQVRVR